MLPKTFFYWRLSTLSQNQNQRAGSYGLQTPNLEPPLPGFDNNGVVKCERSKKS